MRRIPALFILLLCALLLAGCPASVPAPAPLQLSGATYQATDDDQLAIAVDASGAQYIARIECGITTGKACRVIYESRRAGARVAYHVYYPAGDYLFRNPDIAVTDSGTAFMTWQNCPADPPTTRLCSTWYISSSSFTTLPVLDTGTHSLSAPVVAARGETVYVVHEVTNGATGSALRYCQLSPVVNPCHWVGQHPDPATDTVSRRDASAAVSSAGVLYITWLENDGSAVSAARYSDNYGALNSDMSAYLTFGSSSHYLPPAIAVETDDTWVYILTPVDNTPGSGSDTMDIWYCAPTNCASAGSVQSVVMPSGKSWKISGTPSLTAGSGWAAAAFAAENSDTGGIDIFSFTFTAGYGGPTPAVVPYNNVAGAANCDPVVVMVSGFWGVGWHTCGFPPSRGDLYFYSGADGPDGVIHSPATIFGGRGGLDMASNGDKVAGIWNEVQADGRVATWLVYNGYMVFLPALKK